MANEASEPMSSLVNELETLTLWTEGVCIDSRCSRVGMFLKICCPVLETRWRGWGGHRPERIRKRKRNGCRRDNITPDEGRNPALFMQLKSGGSRDCHVAPPPETIRTLQRKRYTKALLRTGLSLLRTLRLDQP